MKRYLILFFIFFNLQVAHGAPVDATLQGYSPSVIDNTYRKQIRGLNLEKNFIHSTPKTKPKDGTEHVLKKRDVKIGELTYNPHFFVNDIVFEGNTVYKDKVLRELAADVLGQDVYLEDVLELTVRISRFYQSKGYLTTYAYVAPQEIEKGVVQINIMESRVEQKIFSGNRWSRDWYMENVALAGTHLNKGKVFNVKQLQGAIKHINNEDYMKTSAVDISKNPETENTIIELAVIDRIPISFDVSWDDYGRDFTGRQRVSLTLGYDNLTGFGDKIYGGTILSSGTTSALAGYSIPVSKYGTRLGFDYSATRMRINSGPFSSLGINGKANDIGVRVIQPIINNATTDLASFAAFNAINSNTDLSVLDTNLAQYSIRVFRSGLYGMTDDITGRWIGNLALDIGVNGMGASPNLENGPQSAFYKVKGEAIRVQRLPGNSLGILKLNGQYTPQSLYAFEKMYLGGPYSIRGFQPSELIGDYGVAGSVEFRTPIPFLREALPEKFKSLDDKIKIAVFYDWGYVNDHKDVQIFPTNFLQAVGTGAYIYLTNALSLQIGVGIPIGKTFPSADNARMYFSLNTAVDKIFLKPK